MPRLDDELLELFGDDPEALAVVDAIAATQRRRRVSPRPRGVVALVAAAVVIAIAVAALTRSTSRAGVIDQALNKIPSRAVIHLVLVDSRSSATSVDLRSGTTSQLRHTVEEWFDARTGTRRVVDRVGTAVVTDTQLDTRSPSARVLDLASLSKFPTLYRRALDDARAAGVRPAYEAKRNVYWIRFSDSRLLAAAAVDAKTFRPVEVRFRGERGTQTFRLADFTKSSTPLPSATPSPARLRSSPLIRTKGVSTRLALPTSLQRLGLSLSKTLPDFGGRELSFADGANGWAVTFGDAKTRGRLPQRFVRIETASDPEPVLGWSSTLLKLAERGHLIVDRTGALSEGFLVTTAPLRFIRITTSEGEPALVQSARRLSAR